MPRYMWFIIATIGLLVGYWLYGKFVEKVFQPDPNRKTPAVTKFDGVDYVSMPKWKLWLIQLLNIAGVGPVFGPIMGALYGPQALLWIVLGSIFAGAVHDYFGGMLSVRYQGANIPQIVGYNLGKFFKQLMRVFAVILLLLVGVVFATSPANLLSKLPPESLDFTFWLGIIFVYYFIATLVPIDKLIGRIYPIFGALLIVMAVGITAALFLIMPEQFYSWAEWGVNPHPADLPLWPLMFITIACGALSGFHATQSPLMARCIESETEGRMVFYGGMIAEGFIGLVWATVGMTFYVSPDDLNATINAGTASAVVYDASIALMGSLGGLLAILGVIVLPITSGDTAFRAARLTIAEVLDLDQTQPIKRLYIAVPLFALGIALSFIDFNIIWRYFGFSNQVLAGIMLWTAAAYLYRRNKLHLICSIPAAFISAACVTYIIYEPNMGLGVDIFIAQIIGLVAAVGMFVVFLMLGKSEIEGAPMDV